MRDMRNFIALCAMVLAHIALCATSAAQDHHPLHRDFYRLWRAPDNPAASCCDARIEENGQERGDCEPAAARIRDGRWQVWIRQTGNWLPVPDEKVLRERNPNGQDGHVCWTPSRGIICFVPPDTGN